MAASQTHRDLLALAHNGGRAGVRVHSRALDAPWVPRERSHMQHYLSRAEGTMGVAPFETCRHLARPHFRSVCLRLVHTNPVGIPGHDHMDLCRV